MSKPVSTKTVAPRRVRRVRSSFSEINTRVRAITTTQHRSNISRQVEPDYANGMLGGLTPIKAPYDLLTLDAIYEKSNITKQCVAAYVTNIALNGWDVVPVSNHITVDESERQILQSFVDSANYDESLTSVHAGVVEAFERRGHAYIEVIRDRKGRVAILRNVPGLTMSLCPKNPEPVEVSYDVVRGPRISLITEYKTFRLYRQQIGGKVVYFKEFGDPRSLNRTTGQFGTPAAKVAPVDEATEIIHFKQSSEDVYGVPRWINQLPSILGSREAEEVNLRYFEDNTVPPMLLTVAGGRLTAESFRQLKALLTARGVGKERQNQILLLEAVPERESLEDKGSVSLKVDKLTDTRQSDGLFKEYDEANQSKVMSSFRLAPINIGKSADHNYATAQTAMFVAESQVYAPLRRVYDEWYNKRLVNNPLGLGLTTVMLRSRAPLITNPEMLVKTLTALNVMGGLTPRQAQIEVFSVLRIEGELYPEVGEDGYEEWMDMPLALALKSREGKSEDTQDEQSQKDGEINNVEDEGEVVPPAPEHGQE